MSERPSPYYLTEDRKVLSIPFGRPVTKEEVFPEDRYQRDYSSLLTQPKPVNNVIPLRGRFVPGQ